MFANLEYVHEKEFNGFSVRYILINKKAEECGSDVYGVRLEKTCSGVLNEEAEVWLSESRDAALRVAKKLCDAEVTPISLYEVIDRIEDTL